LGRKLGLAPVNRGLSKSKWPLLDELSPPVTVAPVKSTAPVKKPKTKLINWREERINQVLKGVT
jgi:hypothetical protein